MEIKKLNIKSVEFYRERETDYGVVYDWNVLDANGNRYSYTSRSKDDPKVVEGEGTYEVHEMESNIKKWYKIKPYKKKNYSGGSYKKRTPEEESSIATQVAQECAIRFVGDVSPNLDKQEPLNAIIKACYLWLKHKDGYRGSNALRRAVEMVKLFPKLGEKKSADLFAYADLMYKQSDPNNFKK